MMKLIWALYNVCPGRQKLSSLWRRCSGVLLKSKIQKAKRIFDESSAEPAWLGPAELASLQQRYPFPPEYGYDPSTVEKRGTERAKELCHLLQNKGERLNDFLELGCWDGMVSCALKRMGKAATAIDIRSDGFDERAVQEGVNLLQMDSSQLQFDDDSFDVVFSYDGFEHFADPEQSLKEMLRVVRKGGFIFLNFGPLYMAPMGLHAYRSIPVPYCQFLFEKETLNEYTKTQGLNPVDFDQLNMWTLQDYRTLWDSYSHRYKKIVYREYPLYSHLDLIMQYPSCFKSKTDCFDDLVISKIQVLFQKNN